MVLDSFLLTQAIVALINVFGLGLIYLFIQNQPKSMLTKYFTLMTVLMFVWVDFAYLARIPGQADRALLWIRIAWAITPLLFILVYFFTNHLTGLSKRFATIQRIILILGLAFIPTVLFTDTIIKGIQFNEFGVLQIVYGKLVFGFFGAVFAFSILSFWSLIHKIKTSNDEELNKKLKVLLAGLTFFLAMNSVFNIIYPVFFNVVHLYYLGDYSTIVFLGLMVYTIAKYRFLNIKIVLRKSSVFIVSIATIVVIAILLKGVMMQFGFTHIFWEDLLVLALMLPIYRPIQEYYSKVANKYFFTSLYDTDNIITEASNKLRSTIVLDELYLFIHFVLNKAFRFQSFGLYEFDKEKKEYVLAYNQELRAEKGSVFLIGDYLKEQYIKKNIPIITDEIKKMRFHEEAEQTVKELEKLKIEVIIPLNVRDQIVGLIALGKKETGEPYGGEDLRVMDIVGAQAAISLENALLFRETKDQGQKLQAEVKRATEDLRAANIKLMQLDEAKSEFVSIASHQLRTPLTIIKGYVSMILEKTFGPLPQNREESLEKVYESNERLIQLVENLLNIDRIESGRLQFNFRVMQFEDLVNSVVDEIRGNASKKGLKFFYEEPKEPLPPVKMDEEKIRQVVMNLIDNAIKYTKQGSVTVTVKQRGKNIHFCVSDSGMGISKDSLPNLFKKFSRGSGTSLVHTEGTGLGLYVAKQMIESHKGHIWAESKGADQGSKFCFVMPITRGEKG